MGFPSAISETSTGPHNRLLMMMMIIITYHFFMAQILLVAQSAYKCPLKIISGEPNIFSFHKLKTN